MATHKITDTQAFDLLRGISQHRHLKLRDIAAEVVLTGELNAQPPPTLNPGRRAVTGLPRAHLETGTDSRRYHRSSAVPEWHASS